MGNELTWILLGGEVVVDYSLRLKSELGPKKTWVSSYSNDVMAYIPSRRVLGEGGYEGGLARYPYGLPAPWDATVEQKIVDEVHKLAAAVDKEIQVANISEPPDLSSGDKPCRSQSLLSIGTR